MPRLEGIDVPWWLDLADACDGDEPLLLEKTSELCERQGAPLDMCG